MKTFAFAMTTLAVLPAALGLMAAPEAALAEDAKKAPPASRVIVNKGEEPPEPLPPVVQAYQPRPAMWKVADADTTLYLFGTHHILPDGFRWRTARFDKVVAGADELVVETSDSDSEAQFEELGPDFVAGMMSRSPTSERLAEENGAKWRQIAAASGVPFEVFDRMPALFAMLSAGLSLSAMTGSTHEHGVETYLETEFARAGKRVESIEDAGAVMRALLAIDEAPLIAQLDTDLSAWDGESMDGLFSWDEDITEADPYASEHAWAKGELEPVFSAEELSQPAFVAINEVLMLDRNRAWSKWLKTRLDRPGTVLVAVGAGHFEGNHSLLAFLKEQGLSAERVQ